MLVCSIYAHIFFCLLVLLFGYSCARKFCNLEIAFVKHCSSHWAIYYIIYISCIYSLGNCVQQRGALCFVEAIRKWRRLYSSLQIHHQLYEFSGTWLKFIYCEVMCLLSQNHSISNGHRFGNKICMESNSYWEVHDLLLLNADQN